MLWRNLKLVMAGGKKRHKCLLKVVKNSLKYNVVRFNIKLFKFLWCKFCCCCFCFSDGDVTMSKFYILKIKSCTPLKVPLLFGENCKLNLSNCARFKMFDEKFWSSGLLVLLLTADVIERELSREISFITDVSRKSVLAACRGSLSL